MTCMDETQWLKDNELAAWVRFTAVLELLPAALNTNLTKQADLTYFEYFCLAMLSETQERMLLTSELAARSNATLPRLSRVLTKLEKRGLVTRNPCEQDRRATEIHLTDSGWDKIQESAPIHVKEVRRLVIDALEPDEIEQLSKISAALLTRLDPEQKMLASSPVGRKAKDV